MKNLLAKILWCWWILALILLFGGFIYFMVNIAHRNAEAKRLRDDEGKTELAACVERTDDVDTCHFWIYGEHLYKQDAE